MTLETFFEKFELCADAPGAVARMRELVRYLAVAGKLVSQDPNDEPAKELIDRIRAMRRSGKEKEYAPLTNDEIPYEIPSSWSWVRLGDISLKSDSGWSPQCLPESRTGKNWGVLKVSAVSWGVFKPEENKALPPGMNARPDCEVQPGDFLLSRANTEELVARSVVVEQTPPRLMMSDKIVRFTFPRACFLNAPELNDASKKDPTEICFGEFVVAGRDTTERLDSLEEILHKMPLAVGSLVIWQRVEAVALRRNTGCYASFKEPDAQ